MKLNLIKSISGIRGIFENKITDTLTETFIRQTVKKFVISLKKDKLKILVGRDSRKSGKIIKDWIIDELIILGFKIYDTDYTTTPTLALAVKDLYDAGIMITASHNPSNWNGLKFFNTSGECFTQEEWDNLFTINSNTKKKNNYQKNYNKLDSIELLQHHISKISKLDIFNKDLFKNNDLKIAIDGINSYSGIALKHLLEFLNVNRIFELNFHRSDIFNRNPEPNSNNLDDLCNLVKQEKCDIGFALDPDGDRLAIVDENGVPWGEEYTLITSTDYILQKKTGFVVSNLSSSMILERITKDYNQKYYTCATGEANVIKKIKEIGAIIGGEGNGGVIYPNLNNCRDALVGCFLILSNILENQIKASSLKNKFPTTFFKKEKISIKENKLNFNQIKQAIKKVFKNDVNFLEADGLKIFYENSWILIRKSNTEPIIRLYAESYLKNKLNLLSNVKTIKEIVLNCLNENSAIKLKNT